MATQSIRQQVVVAVPREKATEPSRIKEFFSTIADLAGVYFGSGASIGHLDSDYRASLSAKEKAALDANMNGIWTS